MADTVAGGARMRVGTSQLLVMHHEGLTIRLSPSRILAVRSWHVSQPLWLPLPFRHFHKLSGNAAVVTSQVSNHPFTL